MFSSIHHISLSVSQLERSIQFYCDLGFKLEASRNSVANDYFRKVIGYPEGVVHTALLTCRDSVRLELIQYVVPQGLQIDLSTPNIGSTHLCFIVEDIRAETNRLVSLGVVFKSEPVEMDGGPNKGGFAVYFLDPDGYTMELLQFPENRIT